MVIGNKMRIIKNGRNTKTKTTGTTKLINKTKIKLTTNTRTTTKRKRKTTQKVFSCRRNLAGEIKKPLVISNLW